MRTRQQTLRLAEESEAQEGKHTDKPSINDEGMKEYVDKLEATGIGADGWSGKLDSLVLGLRYLAHLHRKEDNTSYVQGIQASIQQIQNWKKVFAKRMCALKADCLVSFSRRKLTTPAMQN